MAGGASSARWVAVCLATLLFGGCGSLAALTSSSSPRSIVGTVRDESGPIPGARVELTSYQDARCVTLATRPDPPSDEEQRELRACIMPLGATVTNEAGAFTFPNVRPGSYDLTIVWALRQGQTVPANPVFTEDDFAVVIVSNSDGTWTVTARSEIMPLSGQSDAIKDFTFQPPDR